MRDLSCGAVSSLCNGCGGIGRFDLFQLKACLCICVWVIQAANLSLREKRDHQRCISMKRSMPGTGRHEPAREGQTWLSRALNPAYFLPGMVIGFLLGLWVELPKGGFGRGSSSQDLEEPTDESKGSRGGRKRGRQTSVSSGSRSAADSGGELKMVFVVRQDLRMGGGKIASQCAHAAVGIYHELLTRQRALLNRWEECGQPKIVVTCKNQQEMNMLRSKAEIGGLPTFTVADAGRTQVAAGSKTVLVIGPGTKARVDSVTRHLRLL